MINEQMIYQYNRSMTIFKIRYFLVTDKKDLQVFNLLMMFESFDSLSDIQLIEALSLM